MSAIKESTRALLKFQWFNLSSRHLTLVIRALVPLLGILTTLFLLLPGVSGPGVSFYWLRVEYEGRVGTWDLGSLGACRAAFDGSCEAGGETPPHWKQADNLLTYHLATGTIFSLLASFSWTLFEFPESRFTKRWATLVPLANLVLPSTILIADLAVPESIGREEDVKSVQRVGAYWLGPVSFVLSVIWCIAIQLDGASKRREAGLHEVEESKPAPEEARGWAEKVGDVARRAWPWYRDHARSAQRQEKEERDDTGRGEKGRRAKRERRMEKRSRGRKE